MPLIKIQIRRDTAANWTASNPVLDYGEPAIETDTGKTKTGDGIRNWASLPYDIEASLSSASPLAAGTAAAGTAKTAARADHVHPLPTSVSTQTLTTTGNATIGGDLAVTGTLTFGSLSVPVASVTGLPEAVDDRVAQLMVAGTGISFVYNDTSNTLTASIGAHTHAIADVTGLQAALDTKAATIHTHAIADVTGLTASLATKAVSDPTNIVGAAAVTNIVFMSQVAYDALSPKSATTLYIIV